MPTYEYRCPECGNEFDKFGKMSDPPVTECPSCHAQAQRKISAGAGLVFKGSGFYITDYKKSGQSGGGEGGSSSSGGGESKPESKGESSAPKPEPKSSGSSSSGGAGKSE